MVPKFDPETVYQNVMGPLHLSTFVKNAKGPFLSKTDKICKRYILTKRS